MALALFDLGNSSGVYRGRSKGGRSARTAGGDHTICLVFLIANFQLSLARYYQSAKKETLAQLHKSCGVLMFFACLLAVAEAGMDAVIAALSRGTLIGGTLLSGTAFAADWLLNLFMVVLAALSLDRCVCLLVQDTSRFHQDP